MKKLFPMIAILAILTSCGNDKPKEEKTEEDSYEAMHEKANEAVVSNATDPTKGIGQIKEVTLNTPLEQERIGRGKAIYEMKCSACHQITDQRVVGPGWKD